jgi:hypothetical protein
MHEESVDRLCQRLGRSSPATRGESPPTGARLHWQMSSAGPPGPDTNGAPIDSARRGQSRPAPRRGAPCRPAGPCGRPQGVCCGELGRGWSRSPSPVPQLTGRKYRSQALVDGRARLVQVAAAVQGEAHRGVNHSRNTTGRSKSVASQASDLYRHQNTISPFDCRRDNTRPAPDRSKPHEHGVPDP